MAKKRTFSDGLKNVVNKLINNRNASATNKFSSAAKIPDAELRAIYKTGIGNRIVNLKTRYALNDTLQFDSEHDAKFFEETLFDDVVSAAEKMLSYGRSIIVLFRKGDDLSKPLIEDNDNPHPLQRRVFEGEYVTVMPPATDLMDDRFDLPTTYVVNGTQIHWSRVVDFKYVSPPRRELPSYQYGGISEFELIYGQLINDAVVERASGAILEKSSTLFYKLEGYRDALRSGGDDEIVSYFEKVEELRGIYGAGIIDVNDNIENISQALNNLSETDMISLRRLSMVTGIPVSWLVGENVKGLNSSGDNERQIMQDTAETMQRTYLLRPINELLKHYGKGAATFKNNQGETPTIRLDYETKAIANAEKLNLIGEDATEYLHRHDVITPSKFDMFEQDIEDAENEAIDPNDLIEGDDNETQN